MRKHVTFKDMTVHERGFADVALVRIFCDVFTHVRFKVTTLFEGGGTLIAFERFFSGVIHRVKFQSPFSSKRFQANIAFKVFHFCMSQHVIF